MGIATSTAMYDPAFTNGDIRFDPATSMLMGTPQGRNAFGENPDTTLMYNPGMSRWLDALNGLSQGGKKKVQTAGMDGLPTDTHYGTLPLSLQGLQGADYDYDDQGAPTGVRMKRGQTGGGY